MILLYIAAGFGVLSALYCLYIISVFMYHWWGLDYYSREFKRRMKRNG